MLRKIKTLLGITDNSKDAILTILIDSACEEARNITHDNTITDQLEMTICDMVIYKYNRIDTTGVDSESYSGVSFGYSHDYPESIIRQLKANRKLVIK